MERVEQSGGQLSRNQIRKAIADGRLSVGGVPVTKGGRRLQDGEVVRLVHATPLPSLLVPEDIPLVVPYEDAHLALIDKPIGMCVHPARGHRTGTLVHALLHRYQTLGGAGDSDRPGIVHRLDLETSGLLVVARDDVTHRLLQDAFRERRVHRRYLAIVAGPRIADAGTLDTSYGRHANQRLKMTGRGEHDRRAVTHWKVAARSVAFALLVVRLQTGRTHQIRVHMSESGHPIVGDQLYAHALPSGGGGRLAVELAAARRMPRQALHAARLSFEHPRLDGVSVTEWADPPPDMTDLIAALFGDQALVRARALAEEVE